MNIDEHIQKEVSAVESAETNIFSELIQLTSLKPGSDFVFANLGGVDFNASDLQGFDFSYADLRGAIWAGRLNDPASVKHALRGAGSRTLSGRDFHRIAAVVELGSTWAERFMGFTLLVENWGENKATLGILVNLLNNDKSIYCKNAALVFFFASRFKDEQAMTLCKEMALAGRAQINMFRMRKLRRYLEQYASLMQSREIKERYPEDFSQEDAVSLYPLAARLVRNQTSNRWV